MTKPKPKPKPKRKAVLRPRGQRYIVGIGASAGGLEALRTLFGSVQDTNDMSFIVVQHLAPQHRSRLVELIAHSTTIPVIEARDGALLEVGVIYVTPPNRDVFVEKGKLRLRLPQMKVGPKPSIDLFFKSLAEDAGELAIGVVLSGTGSDGALGIRAIKAGGGVTIAQKIDSAKYDGMPKAAKQTGQVDFELTPEEIARELARVNSHRKARGAASHRAEPLQPDAYEDILGIIEKEAGASFSLYKQSTIRRRIDRRVVATRSDNVEQYSRYLRETPEEGKLLFQDILISVTAFFRDGQAFKALEHRLAELVRRKPATSAIRCWVVGCATGEEAYSLAILLSEICDRLRKHMTLQIFASDLDEQALAVARKGVYAKASLVELPKGLLGKYFSPLEDDRFQVKPAIRDAVIFARHNVAQDPPFLNLDLASCRNVLIYFTGNLQERVFKTLHYSLGKEGLLFLGKSEAAPTGGGYFEVVDKAAKIYSRVERKGELPRAFSRMEATREARLISEERGEAEAPASDLFGSMIASFAPDSVIVDEDQRVRHLHGNAGTYLNMPAGEATYAISRMLPPEMGLELAALLHRARKVNSAARGRVHELRGLSGTRLVQLAVAPLREQARRSYLVAFESREPEPEAKAERRGRASALPPAETRRRLEKELAATRDQLQTVVEEHETANEELQSLNEELQSANEELQSSNEELETANEELQSTNEELTTLNQELNVKSAELLALNQALQAVQAAIIYPLVIVDRHLKIANFNPAARHLLRLSDQDVGSHVRTLPALAEMAGVSSMLEDAVRRDHLSSLQLRHKDRSFEVQVQVYRGARDAVLGAVVSFVDNTEITSALEESRLIKRRLSDILDNTPAVVTMKDTSGVIVYANPRFAELVGRKADEVAGQTDEELFGAETGEQIRERDYEIIKRRKAVQFEERMRVRGRTHWFASSKFPLLDAKRRVQSVCTVSLDVTEQVLHQRQLELFKKAVSSSTSGVMLLEEEGEGFVARFVSDEFCRTLGLEPGALDGLPLPEVFKRVFPLSELAQIRDAASRVQEGPVESMIVRVPGAESERWVELRGHPLSIDPEDERRHLILTLVDVTAKVESQKTIALQQDELSRFGKFAALGEVAAGIAHEINTPLNVITAKTDLLRKLAQLDKLEKDRAVKAALEIDQMAKNISGIVLGLKSLVREDSAEPERIDLRQVVRDTLKVCEYRLQRYGVELRLDLPAREVHLRCHPVQISQIIINLVNNAVDAIREREEGRWICVKLEESREQARLFVSDCGEGIDPGLAEKIMTPFFTTKKDGEGTGIGLSLSRTIARRHGGDLILDPDATNTTFRLELPKKKP